jgi:hypothetical protein
MNSGCCDGCSLFVNNEVENPLKWILLILIWNNQTTKSTPNDRLIFAVPGALASAWVCLGERSKPAVSGSTAQRDSGGRIR